MTCIYRQTDPEAQDLLTLSALCSSPLPTGPGAPGLGLEFALDADPRQEGLAEVAVAPSPAGPTPWSMLFMESEVSLTFFLKSEVF